MGKDFTLFGFAIRVASPSAIEGAQKQLLRRPWQVPTNRVRKIIDLRVGIATLDHPLGGRLT
jgi:hypothetical protein